MELVKVTDDIYRRCLPTILTALSNYIYNKPSQFTKYQYLPMKLCDVILRTNRVRCALNMEILDLLNEESISGARSGRASL